MQTVAEELKCSAAVLVLSVESTAFGRTLAAAVAVVPHFDQCAIKHATVALSR